MNEKAHKNTILEKTDGEAEGLVDGICNDGRIFSAKGCRKISRRIGQN